MNISQIINKIKAL